MDVLSNKTYQLFDYISRYTNIATYYNKKDDNYVSAIGTNMRKDIPWVAHSVRQEDTLDSLALKYYNNPTLWWAIAYFNNILDPFIKLSIKFDTIKIPALSSIEFGEERS